MDLESFQKVLNSLENEFFIFDQSQHRLIFSNKKANEGLKFCDGPLEDLAPWDIWLGFSKDEFILSIENGVLSVSVDTEDSQSQIDNTTVQEFSFQSFRRSWTLPDGVSQERISARYDAGLLYIDVPTEEKRETKLTINVE